MSNESENPKLPASGAAEIPNEWKMPEPIFRVSGGTIIGSISKEQTPAANHLPNQNATPTEIVGEEKRSFEIKIQSGVSENPSRNRVRKYKTPTKSNRHISTGWFVAAALLALIICAAAVFYFF